MLKTLLLIVIGIVLVLNIVSFRHELHIIRSMPAPTTRQLLIAGILTLLAAAAFVVFKL